MPPRDATVAEGESVEFTCSAVGIPHPTIQWLFKDGVISTEAVLSIQEVEEEDEGSYTCVASSSAGEAEASATLTLFGKRFLQWPHRSFPCCCLLIW